MAQTRVLVDMSRATLKDLVEDFLKMQLGYGEVFTVNNEVGTLYDEEEEENLTKKLSELGMFIRIIALLLFTNLMVQVSRVTAS